MENLEDFYVDPLSSENLLSFSNHDVYQEGEYAFDVFYNEEKSCTEPGVNRRVLCIDEISIHFNKTVPEAAKILGVGVTALKQRCRELGIARWPYRRGGM